MDRLTMQNYDYADCEFMDSGIAPVFNRLSSYEDTGLEPEEITEYLNATDEYVEASEEGRLIVLPSDPYEMADVAQEILSRACRLQREAEAALGGDGDDD